MDNTPTKGSVMELLTINTPVHFHLKDGSEIKGTIKMVSPDSITLTETVYINKDIKIEDIDFRNVQLTRYGGHTHGNKKQPIKKVNNKYENHKRLYSPFP